MINIITQKIKSKYIANRIANYYELKDLVKQQVKIIFKETEKDFSEFLFDKKFDRKYQNYNIVQLINEIFKYEINWLNKEDQLIKEYRNYVKNQIELNPQLELVLQFVS